MNENNVERIAKILAEDHGDPQAWGAYASKAMQIIAIALDEWKPIETAVALDRVIVAGWQIPSGGTVGYWWWYEDMTDENGVPIDHPDATIWHEPIPLPTQEG